MSIISYLKAHNLFAKSIAVSFAIVALASCGEKAGGSMFQTGEDAADVYRSYLSEVREVESLPTERLMLIVPAVKSMSVHLSPHISPRRKPVMIST